MRVISRLWYKVIIILVILFSGCQNQSPATPTPDYSALPPISLLTPGATSNQPSLSPSRDNRPNILFILTDDLDMGSLEYMPKLQQYIGEHGMQFSKFYVNVSFCCPSRASILLGQYSHNTHVLTNVLPNGGFQTFHNLGLEKHTIGVTLQTAGYQTIYLGKYLNGYPKDVGRSYVPPGWSEWYSPAAGKPYSGQNYRLNANGEIIRFGNEPEAYITDILTRYAADFIRRNAESNQPFFMHMSTYAPHDPANPAPRHLGIFNDIAAPHPPSYNEEDVSDKPAYIRERQSLTPEKEKDIDNLYKKRLQSLQSVDDMIATLVQTLDETGLLENTYIFFTSDNGYHIGHHRLKLGKSTPYEVDIQVPLFVRGPGVSPGSTTLALAGNIDFAPTFVDIAGLPPDGSYDGRSLLPILEDGDRIPKDWRTAYLLENWTSDSEIEESTLSRPVMVSRMIDYAGLLEPPDPDEVDRVSNIFQQSGIPGFKGIRTSKYLYVEYFNGEIELYDVDIDPHQLDNIASTAPAGLIEQLQKLLAELAFCQGDNCNRVVTILEE